MINITRWSPDTCNCVIEYSWDTETSEDDRVHEFHRVVEQCEEHSEINKHQDVHDHVLAENQTKNKVMMSLFKHTPRHKHKTVNPDGTISESLNPAVNYKWKFQGKGINRELKISFEGAKLSSQEKTSILNEPYDKPVSME